MDGDLGGRLDRTRSGVTRRRLRIAFLLIIVICGAYLAYGAATGVTTATQSGVSEAPPTGNHTVVTESAKFGTIIAYAPDGSVTYYNNTHTKYFDVDSVEGESMTVEYTATDTVHTSGPRCQDPPCTRNVIERANLSTGEVTEMVVRYDHRENAGEWHDHVRVDEDRVVVADIADDQVFMLNTETGIREWAWEAQSDFPVDEGGSYPGDWAHINDVSVLDDGRVMVSLRNQDQVVFIDPETGMNESWTLGEEDDHGVQYEQHNPDYIPEERGGPAVVVADSENERVQEFGRDDGEWTRTWVWSDERMQWPRDADRLPNGNTLIVDSMNHRVIEVTPAGEVVWEMDAPWATYDAERVAYGDEPGGPTIRDQNASGNVTLHGGTETGVAGAPTIPSVVKGVVAATPLPAAITNAAESWRRVSPWFKPTWMPTWAFSIVVVCLLVVAAWAVGEGVYQRRRIRRRVAGSLGGVRDRLS